MWAGICKVSSWDDFLPTGLTGKVCHRRGNGARTQNSEHRNSFIDPDVYN